MRKHDLPDHPAPVVLVLPQDAQETIHGGLDDCLVRSASPIGAG